MTDIQEGQAPHNVESEQQVQQSAQAQTSALSDSEILRLANDKSFGGAFSGVRTLQKFLLLDYGQHVSLKRLYSIMKKSPDYLMNLKPVRQFTRRHYQVYSFGQLLEMDLGKIVSSKMTPAD